MRPLMALRVAFDETGFVECVGVNGDLDVVFVSDF